MKVKSIFMALAALMVIIMFSSCEKIKGKGDVVNEIRTTGTYSSIGLAMSATLYFTPGATYRLQVVGQQNILDEIVTQVEGNQLVIKVKNGVTLKNYDPVKVYVTAPGISGLDISGSGDIFTDSSWVVSDLSTRISGSGSINISGVETTHLLANISGSGSIRVTTGKVSREDLTISGSGTIDLRSVEAETVYTTTSGSGDTYTFATSLLDVTISGSGNVWYYGNPAINTHISGSGNIRKM